MTSFGRPAGPTMLNQILASKPGNPASAIVGTSGNIELRLPDESAKALNLPACMCEAAAPNEEKRRGTCPPSSSVMAGLPPL